MSSDDGVQLHIQDRHVCLIYRRFLLRVFLSRNLFQWRVFKYCKLAACFR